MRGRACVCVWRRMRQAAREGKKNGFMGRRWGSWPQAEGSGFSRTLAGRRNSGWRTIVSAVAPLAAWRDNVSQCALLTP